MIKKVLYSLILMTFFASCKKNNDTNSINHENILNDKAHIVDTSSVLNCTISLLKLDKSKISFTPVVGDIILASPTSNNPKGVLSKILTISQNGNTITCTTQSSNLNEAFKQLFIDYKYVKDYSQNAQLRGVAGIPFPTNYQLTSGFTVNGLLQLNVPDVQIKYSKPDGALLPDTVLILASVNTNGSNLTMQANGALSVPEKTLYTFNNLPIIEVPVVVAGVPLIIPFWQYIEVNTLPLNISGRMKFSIYPQFSAALGVSYINGTWTNLSGFNIGASAEKPIKTDFNANLTANITFFNPTYKIGPFWDPTLYAFFKVPNELDGKIQTTIPNYSLKYKLGIEAGVHYDFWLGISGQKSFSIPVYSTTLKEGNWGYNIGDTAFGGIIFYLDSTTSFPNQHGMVCALTNQSNSMVFIPANFSTPFQAFGVTIGSGLANTNTIVSTFGNAGNAAAICKNYAANGYNDWFLPSRDELNELCLQKRLVHVDSIGNYWSSTSMGSQNMPLAVSAQNFTSNQQFISYYQVPENRYKVRAVRKF